ncbi:MAG: hypothetical protein ABIJ48_03985 [Actinomycetota bacterium]
MEVRLPDGIHYSAAGGRRLTAVVLEAVVADWGFTHLLGKSGTRGDSLSKGKATAALLR